MELSVSSSNPERSLAISSCQVKFIYQCGSSSSIVGPVYAQLVRLNCVCVCVFVQVAEKLEELKTQHGEKLAMKESLRKKSEDMEVKLDRADKLVTGLAGERVRWEERVTVGHTHTHLGMLRPESWSFEINPWTYVTIVTCIRVYFRVLK